MDPRLLSEAGGDILLAKIPSPHKIVQLTFQPGMFTTIKAGSLLVVDNIFLENLRDAVARAVQDGSFHQCGLVLLVNVQTLDSSDRLTQLNLSLRSLWSSTTVVIKPWTGGIARTDDGKFVTSSIRHIADRIGQGIRRLPKLLKIQVRLLCMHKSGRVVSNGPIAPPSPSKQLMLSMEICTYLRAVSEAATAQDAINLWQLGPAQTTPLKRLQPKKNKTPRERGTSRAPADVADTAATTADVVAAPAAKAAPAAEEAQAVAVAPPLLTPVFITIIGNEWPNKFFPSFGQNLIFVVLLSF